MTLQTPRLRDAVIAWSRATFPRSSVASVATHLEREAGELRAAARIGGAPTAEAEEEIADVQMLLWVLADKLGGSIDLAVRRKLEVCKSREWGQPDREGVVEHIRQGDGK